MELENPAFVGAYGGPMTMETQLGEGSGAELLPGHNVDMEEELGGNPAFVGPRDALMMSAPFSGPTIVHPSRNSSRQKSAGSTASAGGVELGLSDDDLLGVSALPKRHEVRGTPRGSKKRAASDPTSSGEREDSSDEDDRFAFSYPGASGGASADSAPSAAPTHSTAWAQASAAAQGGGRGGGRGGSTATRGGVATSRGIVREPTKGALHRQPRERSVLLNPPHPETGRADDSGSDSDT